MWFPVISPQTLPSASREIPSCSPQKESPQQSRGKGSTTHPHPLHHPSGVGIDGVVKFVRLIYFSVDVLWKVCAQERYVGFLVSEKKSSLTMKEGLDEVVGLGLSDSCLQISDSIFFDLLGFACVRIAKHNQRPSSRRWLFSRLSPLKFRQSAVQSSRLFYFWVNFP